jgi:hypothetical protein
MVPFATTKFIKRLKMLKKMIVGGAKMSKSLEKSLLKVPNSGL